MSTLTSDEHTGEEYLGKDRDELRAIIVERDIEIDRLNLRIAKLEKIIVGLVESGAALTGTEVARG
ncbi:MAG: hypothetical protein JWO52_4114 [Gammaproteobacteria bacterium]|jgi:hypothetical protein|nr:hypothetical protein [Gammaproteobacteria bacterium]